MIVAVDEERVGPRGLRDVMAWIIAGVDSEVRAAAAEIPI